LPKMFTSPIRIATLVFTRLRVLAYDSERVAQNSSAILGLAAPRHALCSIVDRRSNTCSSAAILDFFKTVWANSTRLANRPRKVDVVCENALTWR
jgi:hypothetical protein